MAKIVRYKVKGTTFENFESLSKMPDIIGTEQGQIITALSQIDPHNFFDLITINLDNPHDWQRLKLLTIKMEFNRCAQKSRDQGAFSEFDFRLHNNSHYSFDMEIKSLTVRPKETSVAPHILSIIPMLEHAIEGKELDDITLTAMLSHGPFFWGYIGFKPDRGMIEHFCNMADFMNDQRFKNDPEAFSKNENAIQTLRKNPRPTEFWRFLDQKNISYPLVANATDIETALWFKDAQLGTNKFNNHSNYWRYWGYKARLDLSDFTQRERFDRYLVRGAQKFLHANQNIQPSKAIKIQRRKSPKSFAP